MAESWGPLIGAIVGGAVALALLLLVIMLPLSYTYVEFNEVAFKKSTIDNRVDTTMSYGSGRYFWGLSTTAVRFPSVYQRIEMRDNDLLIFSSAGSEFVIECDVYYRLALDRLPIIFEQVGLNYHERFSEAVRASIKNTAPEFTVDEYIRNRTGIADYMLLKLREDLAVLNQDIIPHKFLLLSFEFPPELQHKFLDTAVQEQLNKKAQFQQEVDLIQKSTEQLLEAVRANRTIIFQNGTATTAVIIKNAQSEADQIRLEAVGQGIAQLFSALSITDPNDRKMLFDLLTVLDLQSTPQLVIGDIGVIISKA